MVLQHRRFIWIHVTAVLWGAFIEFVDWTCPLTPLENWLRRKGGESGYQGGFVDHYIIPLLYPAEMTRNLQLAIGFFVLGLNLIIYSWLHYKRKLPL